MFKLAAYVLSDAPLRVKPLPLCCTFRQGAVDAGVFTTKSQYKKAHKKREKLARRAGWAPSSAKNGQRQAPQSPATPVITETSFAFGSFEQHTTGLSTAAFILTFYVPLKPASTKHCTADQLRLFEIHAWGLTISTRVLRL